MRLAFPLYKFVPYGCMQRDIRRFVEELGQRCHQRRVFRAECPRSALLYARLTGRSSMHRPGAELIERLISRKRKVAATGSVSG